MKSPVSTGPKPPKLLDRVRATMRLNRYSPRTEQAYVDWIKRFIRFHGVRHPQEMGADEVKAFLGHLATGVYALYSAEVCQEADQCGCAGEMGQETPEQEEEQATASLC